MQILPGCRYYKSDRLLKRPEFIALKNGRNVSDRFFILAYRSNTLEKSRLGITVTRKIGGAVIRNRIKRVVREFYRMNRQRISGHWDINIIAKKAAADAPSDLILISLRSLVERIGVK